jgi:curved DNA-binding protein CbpA
MSDYYNLLGVPRQASPDQVRLAFRRLAKRHHPDAHPHLSASERAEMNVRFVQLAQAYETLSDPARRRAYNRDLRLQDSLAEQSTGRAARAAETQHDSHQRQHDQRRRAQERAAEDRQQADEFRRREHERHTSRAWETSTQGKRRAAADAASARDFAKDSKGGARLQDMVRDVDELLARLGVESGKSAEAVWDALMLWARRMFLDVAQVGEAAKRVEAERQARKKPGHGSGHAAHSAPGAQAGQQPSAEAMDGGQPASGRQSKPHAAHASQVPSSADLDRHLEELELQRDLEDLKEEVHEQIRTTGRTRRPPTLDEDLAELKATVVTTPKKKK